MSKQSIYFDYAAATPLDSNVLEAMEPYFNENFYNPSATYLAGVESKKALEDVRSKVAGWLGARSNEIVFTAGGTEANNLAIHGIMRQFPAGKIVVSSIEHESVLAPAQNYDCQQVKVKVDGRLDLDDLHKKITGDTVLLSVIYANNEIGTVQPIREISKLVQAERQRRGPKGLPLYFHTDAAQATNYLDMHVARLGVDLMTINGGKIYGPKQSGVLYVKAGLKLLSLISGGGQERGLRSGTENVAAAVGLASAMDLVQGDRHQEASRLAELQHYFIRKLEELTGVSVNGSLKFRLPNNVHITIHGQDNERLLFQLDEAGIMAAAGSACSASSETPSHVLRAIGLSDQDARASLRFTLGRGTNKAQIDHCLKVLSKLLP